ncbi:hypothetical protein [Microcoleus sp. herbarium14]|uniref:hypothetical protein n=1 Tax=Microcoleus sp. herbarium14 TaxID=3055439 RepID=UPI002FCF3CA7
MPSLLVAWLACCPEMAAVGVTASERFSPEFLETGILKVKTALPLRWETPQTNQAVPHFMSWEAPTRGEAGWVLHVIFH